MVPAQSDYGQDTAGTAAGWPDEPSRRFGDSGPEWQPDYPAPSWSPAGPAALPVEDGRSPVSAAGGPGGPGSEEDTCPLPVISPDKPSALGLPVEPGGPQPAGVQQGDPQQGALARGPFEPFGRPADTPPPASSAQGIVPAAQLGPVSAPARAKLDQINDLYLTAEAIGEDVLVEHFDEVSQRQRQLIKEYFNQAGVGADLRSQAGDGHAQNGASLSGRAGPGEDSDGALHQQRVDPPAVLIADGFQLSSHSESERPVQRG